MRLLFLTQVLDAGDAVLGFVPSWVEALARRVERVRVLALEVGDLSGLPANVDARAVGRRGRIRRYLRYRRYLAEALGRDGFDAVLAHMVPRYLLVSAGPARRAGAGLFLWYTHGGVDRRLQRAVRLADKVFTATPESMRVPSPNKVVTGHGIDLRHFPPAPRPPAPPLVLSVGRLTPAKDPLTVLDALARLVRGGSPARLEWIGAGLTAADAPFRREVEARIEALGIEGRVRLAGALAYRDIPSAYARASVVVNASRTGSLDKVVLEAMASGRPVVTSNEAAAGVLAAAPGGAERFTFPAGDAGALAARLEALLPLAESERAELGRALRAIVERDHDLERLADRLVEEMGA